MHPHVAVRPGQPSFIDFKVHPERIAEVLEDFVPFAAEPAIQSFYGLLEWLNGPESVLESCDCALRPPERHDSVLSHVPLRVHGRLMLMYRDLAANCDMELFAALYNSVGRQLSKLDPEFQRDRGIVTLAPSKTLFRDLMPGTMRHSGDVVSREGEPGRGYQLLLTFEAFGNYAADAFANLKRVFANMETATREASAILRQLTEQR